ncbi:c-opsin [Tribolium castaneum]|uniref:C-opsin n=1 Tax=Tribolium castaneum TaxID=7070 RepID=B8K1S1_TRICA|nr:c-opsin [Tribolium castaneum]AAY89040.1 c-opsin [Tribolium castaneum]|eukprot:NP_001138950.1 c-opsin [Tribolium castaneum]
MKNFNSTEIGDELLIPVEGYIAAAVVLFCIGFFGFSLNLTVIIFMLKERQLWSPLNIILFNLVVSDFLVSVLGNPWTFFSAINYGWIFGETGCTIYGFIMSLLGITSITTLTVLAFERYLLIARPFRNNALNFHSAALSVFSIWLYSLSLTIPPLIGWGEYVHEAANLSCSVNWEEKSPNSTSYILYLFAFGLFLPLVIITFSYVNIILTMRRNAAFRVGQVSKAENKVAYMIFIMIIAFLTAWSPYAIMALIVQFGDAALVTPGMAVIPALLAKSSICYNPVIYIGLNAQFQQAWMQKWKKNRRGSDALGTSGVMLETIHQACRDEKTDKLLEKKTKFCKDFGTDVSML